MRREKKSGVQGAQCYLNNNIRIKAIITVREKALEENVSSYQYVTEGSDPSVNVVLLEDSCAVLGESLNFKEEQSWKSWRNCSRTSITVDGIFYVEKLFIVEIEN